VTGVERAYSIRMFGFGMMRCVWVHHGKKTEALMPVKEADFLDAIAKRVNF